MDEMESLRRREQLVRGERGILEQIARGANLADTLTAIVRLVEAHTAGMICTILLVDERGHVHTGAAPSLPDWFALAIDGEPIGPLAGSCGTAAFFAKPITTADIAHDPHWERYRELASRAGLGASWSVPLLGRDGEVVGTLAHYYREPGDPTPRDLELTEVARYLAEIAIQRQHTDAELRSARAEAERRERQALRQVEHVRELNRLKSFFLNAVSHELRTPLTGIMGYVELLEDEVGGPLSYTQRSFTSNIASNSLRLRRLVDDLLDHARVEAGTFRLELEEADAGILIDEVVASFQLQADAVRVVVEAAPRSGPLRAAMDPQRIEQVLANLITNALKFTPKGGRVVVSGIEEGPWIRFEVSDTGEGIPADQLPRLFIPFGQLEAGQRKGGTGLGLVISKQIVEAHGGTIEVRSEEGQGATFIFRLPRRCYP